MYNISYMYTCVYNELYNPGFYSYTMYFPVLELTSILKDTTNGGSHLRTKLTQARNNSDTHSESGTFTSRSSMSQFTDDTSQFTDSSRYTDDLLTSRDTEYSCKIDSDSVLTEDLLAYDPHERLLDLECLSAPQTNTYPNGHELSKQVPFQERNASEIAWANYQKAVERYNGPTDQNTDDLLLAKSDVYPAANCYIDNIGEDARYGNSSDRQWRNGMNA